MRIARDWLRAGSKRVVTFLRAPSTAQLDLPIERDEARILLATRGEVFTAYVPTPRGGAFMKVIEDAEVQHVSDAAVHDLSIDRASSVQIECNERLQWILWMEL